jgi:hypothetical protein
MNLEQQLRASLQPCEPGPAPMAVVMARLSGAGLRRRSPVRPLLFGAILVTAAAAGILALQSHRSPVQPAAALLVDKSDAADQSLVAGPLAPVDGDTLQTSVVEAVAAPTRSFRVLVQPLQLDTDDSASVASVQQYYESALNELRATRGLVLIVAGLSTQDTPADFRLSMTAQDARSTEILAGRARWQVVLKTESWQNNAFHRVLSIESAGTLDLGSCPFPAELAVSMCTPSGVAARNIEELRRSVFPSIPSTVEEAQAELRDSSRSAAERNQALLAMLSRSRSGDAPVNGDVIRGVLDLIANTPDARQRASLWHQLRGQRHPDLVQPLIDASRNEDDPGRLEVVTMLATDFKDAPEARAALDWVAGTDSRVLVRKVAERALFGDAAWRDYVVSSVKDESLPESERFESLDWMLENRSTDGKVLATLTAVAPDLLDGGVGALADVLVDASKDTSGKLSGLASIAMVEFMSSVNHPAVPELLMTCFDRMPGETTLYFLAQHHDDPRVHRKLEQVAADHPDPKLRARAAFYLREPPAASQPKSTEPGPAARKQNPGHEIPTDRDRITA